MSILVTGGAGYIGSHTVAELLVDGHDVVVVDNLVNGNQESLKRIEQLTGKPVHFHQCDVCDQDQLLAVFKQHQIDSVIHFAGLKAVGESVQKPLAYYHNNVAGTLTLLEVMKQNKVNRFIFSSSATVYGQDSPVPYQETMKTGGTINPYGTSKWMVEQVLTDFSHAHPEFACVLLRYFNPIGAHPSGRIGEDPKGIPNNLLPFIAQVAVGRRERLAVFGNDYDTADGTCVRDYLHVVDLAKGHVKALDWVNANTGIDAFNLGTGSGHSVLEMVQAFEQGSGVTIPYAIEPRRSGDLPAFWADAAKAKAELGWQAELTIEQMMEDTWRWQSANPNGYDN